MWIGGLYSPKKYYKFRKILQWFSLIYYFIGNSSVTRAHVSKSEEAASTTRVINQMRVIIARQGVSKDVGGWLSLGGCGCGCCGWPRLPCHVWADLWVVLCAWLRRSVTKANIKTYFNLANARPNPRPLPLAGK